MRGSITLASALVLGFIGGYAGQHFAQRYQAGGSGIDVPIVRRASRFELIDDSGRVRAVLGTQPDVGSVGLIFYDENGKVRQVVGTQALERDAVNPHLWFQYRPVIEFLNANGRSTLNLALDRWDKPFMVMSSAEWEGQVILGHMATGDDRAASDTPLWRLSIEAPQRAALAEFGVVDAHDRVKSTAFGVLQDDRQHWNR